MGVLSKRIGLTERIKPRAVRELVGQTDQACRVTADSVAGHMTSRVDKPDRQDFLPLGGGSSLRSLLETCMLSKINVYLHAISLSKVQIHFSFFFPSFRIGSIGKERETWKEELEIKEIWQY